MDSDDDDELRQAIQMSLQTTGLGQSSRSSNVIDLTEEEIWPFFDDVDDMEFWKAIVVSMGQDPTYENCRKQKEESQTEEKKVGEMVDKRKRAYVEASISGSDTESDEDEVIIQRTKDVKPTVHPPKTVPAGSSLLGSLNRAQMERERLERLGRAAQTESSSEPLAKRTKFDHLEQNKSIPMAKTPSSDSIHYWDGIIKWTFARGFPVESHHITIEQVLQKDTLKAAVLSAFQIEFPWILQKLNLSNTTVTFIAHSDSPDGESDSVMNQKVQIVFPKLKSFGAFGVGCMHSKLQLLFHADHLRVVIPTGNLVPYDWGETGIMENSMYIQDFPRHPTPPVVDDMPQFAKDLLFFVKAQKLPQHILSKVCEYDFSKSAGVEFVHSMSGEHFDNIDRHGKNGLASAVKRLGFEPEQGQTLQLCYVTSSLGNLNDGFLTEMYRAASGIQQEPAKRGPRNNEVEITSRDSTKFKIFFPSEKTVEQSLGGAGCGGTICLQSNHWNNPAFPKPLIYDCINSRKGLLMHNKVLCGRIVRHKRDGNGQSKRVLVPAEQNFRTDLEEEILKSWIYIGSANLSPSAWGNKPVTDRVKKKAKVVIRNWECGVVSSTERIGFGKDSWDILKRFMIVEGPVPVIQVGKPWIREENDHF